MQTEFRVPDLLYLLAGVVAGCAASTEPEPLPLVPGVYHLVKVNGKVPAAAVDSQPYLTGTQWTLVPDGAITIQSNTTGLMALTYQRVAFLPDVPNTSQRTISFANAPATLDRIGDTLVIRYSANHADICTEFPLGPLSFTDTAILTRQGIELRRPPLFCLPPLVLLFRRQ